MVLFPTPLIDFLSKNKSNFMRSPRTHSNVTSTLSRLRRSPRHPVRLRLALGRSPHGLIRLALRTRSRLAHALSATSLSLASFLQLTVSSPNTISLLAGTVRQQPA
jgi:hypothetical protein